MTKLNKLIISLAIIASVGIGFSLPTANAVKYRCADGTVQEFNDFYYTYYRWLQRAYCSLETATDYFDFRKNIAKEYFKDGTPKLPKLIIVD